jgi:16S rRNA (adenine1518-N6/adenine1519-N6)-dimethyltransferase
MKNSDDAPVLALRAKKAFGQNFLVNEGAIKLITKTALDADAEALLEVGPGPGVLTERLLQDERPLWAMDLDPEAIALLQTRFGSMKRFHLIEGDAVTAALPIARSWSIVGNLPYNAATPILSRFLVEDLPWVRMVLMFQLEVGQKILGLPGTKAYGPLSILAQLSSRVTRLMKLGPGSFRPSPKVDSIVLMFEPRADALPLNQRQVLLNLLHQSFGHRRKTLANNWKHDARMMHALDAVHIPSSRRAESLAPSEWRSLLEALKGHHEF